MPGSRLAETIRSLRWKATFLVVAIAMTISGTPACYLLRRARVPLRVAEYRRSESRIATSLVVMLPGYGDSAWEFERHGFVRAIRRSGIDADVVLVDAHYGYYKKRTLVERLHEDVLGPARASGYRRIVLLGVSLGGLGAVGTAREHPSEVDALVLLAPFLGGSAIERRVRAAGFARFRPDPPDDFFQQNWAYLGGYARGDPRPPLALGFGEHDALARSLRIISPFVPKGRLATVDGAHGWLTWTPIFERWVRDGTMAALCAPAPPQ